MKLASTNGTTYSRFENNTHSQWEGQQEFSDKNLYNMGQHKRSASGALYKSGGGTGAG
jgi:hypothetical protein